MQIHQADLQNKKENPDGTVSVKRMTVWLVDDQKKSWKKGSQIELTNMPGVLWTVVWIYQSLDERLVKDSHDSGRVFESLQNK